MLDILLKREQNILRENNKKFRFRYFLDLNIIKNWLDLESK